MTYKHTDGLKFALEEHFTVLPNDKRMASVQQNMLQNKHKMLFNLVYLVITQPLKYL